MSASSSALPGELPLAVIDSETTGLSDYLHEMWEFAAIVRHPDGSEERHHLFIEPQDISAASEKALELNGFHDRYDPSAALSRLDAAQAIAAVVDGKVVAGMNVGFDQRFIDKLVGEFGITPGWHYTPLDIKAFMAGALRLAPPWRSELLARAVGINPGDFARHGAIGDCEYALACYDRVMAGALDRDALADAVDDARIARNLSS